MGVCMAIYGHMGMAIYGHMGMAIYGHMSMAIYRCTGVSRKEIQWVEVGEVVSRVDLYCLQ